jgi:uncharacterized membrane protein YhaH (DUF805 family)
VASVKEFFIVFKRWRDFSGRSSRREYWMFQLVLVITSFFMPMLDAYIIGFVEGVREGMGLAEHITPSATSPARLLTLTNAYLLVTLIPSISVGVRRLHDIDKSGWWFLITLTVIGILLIIYWACVAGDEDDNRYGTPVLPDLESSNAE